MCVYSDNSHATGSTLGSTSLVTWARQRETGRQEVQKSCSSQTASRLKVVIVNSHHHSVLIRIERTVLVIFYVILLYHTIINL